MIIIYPMLVSENTNINTLPPICKILEKYILVYRMDDVMAYMRALSVPMSFFKTKEGLIQTELQGPPDEESDPWYGLKPESKQKELDDLEKKQKKLGADNMDDGTLGAGARAGTGGGKTDSSKSQKHEIGSVNIDTTKLERDITLEPTWVKMSHPKLGSIIVGVKVVPFKVSSEYNYINYLLNDVKSKTIQTMIETTKRKFIRIFWTFARKLPFMSKTLTGDPSKDVFFAETVHRHNVFCLFNYMDLAETNLLSSTASVQKLFNLGWNSIVLADDVNKRVTFCMKEFHGLCSVMPFGYLSASFGRDYAKTFENMDDVRKSASPFFRFSGGKSLNKLMAAREGKMASNDVFKNKVTNYLEELYKKEEK
jgi:hypothetical protein